jgi:hypothetical protein
MAALRHPPLTLRPKRVQPRFIDRPFRTHRGDRNGIGPEDPRRSKKD